MGSGFARYKTFVVNKCHTCGIEAKSVKVAKTKWARDQGMETGMMWQCADGHIHRTRDYKIESKKVG